jgi:hypothetical protein
MTLSEELEHIRSKDFGIKSYMFIGSVATSGWGVRTVLFSIIGAKLGVGLGTINSVRCPKSANSTSLKSS